MLLNAVWQIPKVELIIILSLRALALFLLTFFLVWISLFLNSNICFLAWQTRLHPRWWEDKSSPSWFPCVTICVSGSQSLLAIQFLVSGPRMSLPPLDQCCHHASIPVWLSTWRWWWCRSRWKLWPYPHHDASLRHPQWPKVTVIPPRVRRLGCPGSGPGHHLKSGLRSHSGVSWRNYPGREQAHDTVITLIHSR